MLKRLELKNVALIDSAIIEFDEGLNVLTGETGSGKSVIIDSLNFVLGAKADKTMIRYGETECVVSAVFSCPNYGSVAEILKNYDLDDGSEEIIITRKFNLDSKGSIRVNGVPFTVGMLKPLTTLLVDVHGQSEHYSLLDKSEQLKVLDKFSPQELSELKGECSEIISALKNIDKSLKDLGGNESERAMRCDILKFQFEEIENAELNEGEKDELEVKKKKIQSAEKLKSGFSAAIEALNGENRALDMLNSALKRSTSSRLWATISSRMSAIV